jgi:hypothetical protein
MVEDLRSRNDGSPEHLAVLTSMMQNCYDTYVLGGRNQREVRPFVEMTRAGGRRGLGVVAAPHAAVSRLRWELGGAPHAEPDGQQTG